MGSLSPTFRGARSPRPPLPAGHHAVPESQTRLTRAGGRARAVVSRRTRQALLSLSGTPSRAGWLGTDGSPFPGVWGRSERNRTKQGAGALASRCQQALRPPVGPACLCPSEEGGVGTAGRLLLFSSPSSVERTHLLDAPRLPAEAIFKRQNHSCEKHRSGWRARPRSQSLPGANRTQPGRKAWCWEAAHKRQIVPGNRKRWRKEGPALRH